MCDLHFTRRNRIVKVRKEQNHGERHANLLELATEPTLCIHGAVAVRHRRQFTVHSPSILPSAHVVGARVLLKPKNYPLEHSKQRRARWWPKRFRCINRWCSEKPKKTPPELTALLYFDQAEIDTFCSDYNS